MGYESSSRDTGLADRPPLVRVETWQASHRLWITVLLGHHHNARVPHSSVLGWVQVESVVMEKPARTFNGFLPIGYSVCFLGRETPNIRPMYFLPASAQIVWDAQSWREYHRPLVG